MERFDNDEFDEEEADDTEGSAEDDDFDYDEFVGREFGNARASTTLSPAYRTVAIVLVIIFALSLLSPLLF